MKVIELEKKYDFWLKNGHVIDPSQNIDEVRDILVKGNKRRLRTEKSILRT